MRQSIGLILLGAGGHAKVVAELARSTGWHVAGFLAPASGQGGSNLDAPLLGDGRDLTADPRWLEEHDLFPAIGNSEVRWREFVRLTAVGARIPSLVHPNAVVSSSARVEAGVVVMAGAIVQADAMIGPAVIVNTGAQVDHDCEIGAGAMIAPGAILCGGVHVGEHAFVGAGAVLVPGIRVGKGAFVGAGTTVVNDLGDGTQLKASRRTHGTSTAG
ncbi:acetyltransferase [Ciceribacter sp. RN22]|uniref:acetyltransferase n=1 Tax=Ciceribacter sp. RN22 TaxID=2954932 RepID=UPI002091EB33|nr:acetyltransferase [Ciceribacter sp. RN22]MCO6179015.1 acetyltransferase [Ciceribacter sp. RN22]